MSRDRYNVWLTFHAFDLTESQMNELRSGHPRWLKPCSFVESPCGDRSAAARVTLRRVWVYLAAARSRKRMRRRQTASRVSLNVPKVFGIGFHKTGTTSLAHALTTLGYTVAGPNGLNDPDIATNADRIASAIAERYDAFQDNPWPVLYREMDERYPGSKFVLTLRPTDAWIQSQVRHFGETPSPMREWIYGAGCPKGNEDVYIARYERHNREVLDYFSQRPNDLLVLDLTESAAWDELCAFLGKDVPGVPFPHSNRAVDRESHPGSVRERLFRRAARLVARLTTR